LTHQIRSTVQVQHDGRGKEMRRGFLHALLLLLALLCISQLFSQIKAEDARHAEPREQGLEPAMTDASAVPGASVVDAVQTWLKQLSQPHWVRQVVKWWYGGATETSRVQVLVRLWPNRRRTKVRLFSLG
jgi:hypothetical protein